MPSRQAITILLACALFCSLMMPRNIVMGQLGEWDSGLFPIQIDGKWGFTDEEGNIAISPQFDFARTFAEGMAGIKMGRKWGFINKRGKIVIPPKFDFTEDFSQGLAKVRIRGKWGFIDTTGTQVIKPEFDYIKNFEQEIAGVLLNHKWGFIDRNGKLVIKPTFDVMRDYKEGLAAIKVRGEWGYIDHTGRIVIEPRFDYVLDFQDGLAIISVGGNCFEYKKCKGGNWGLIDRTGKIITEPRFDYIGPFSEGVASVLVDDTWGFIDRTGDVIIELKFSNVADFADGVAKAKLDGIWGVVDKSGNFVKTFYRNHYAGILERNRHISLELIAEGRKLSGRAIDETDGKQVNLSGTFDVKGSFKIIEHDNRTYKKTGRLIGTFGSGFDTLYGTWSSPNGSKTFSFSLQKVAEYRELEAEEYDLHFHYPHFSLGNKEIQKKVNDLIQSRATRALARVMKKMTKRGPPKNRYVYEEYSLEYTMGSLISLLFIRESFGEEHPSFTRQSLNLWLRSDAVIAATLSHLFKPGPEYKMKLSDLCVADLKKQGALYVTNGIVRSLSEHDLRVVTVSSRGVAFSFAPYILGPYSQGSFTVFLPYDTITGIINPEGPLAPFMVK